MKEIDKENLIKNIPTIIMIVTVGTITGYNLFYTILAGLVGMFIGYVIFKLTKKK